MTAILGFACKDSIVMATDSQVTTGEGRKIEATKLFKVSFPASKKSALIAISGSISGVEIFIEILGLIAAETEVKSWRTIADAAEAAMKQTRQRILSAYAIDEIPACDRIKKLDEYFCSIILAYAHERKPHIFSLHLDSALTVKSLQPFEAFGSGGGILAHTLQGFKLAALNTTEAFGLAAYAVGAAKRSDLGCSGNMQAGCVSLIDEDCSILTSTATLEQSAAEVAASIQSTLGKKIEERFLEMPLDLDE